MKQRYGFYQGGVIRHAWMIYQEILMCQLRGTALSTPTFPTLHSDWLVETGIRIRVC